MTVLPKQFYVILDSHTHECRCVVRGVEGCWFGTPASINRWLQAAENMMTAMRSKNT